MYRYCCLNSSISFRRPTRLGNKGTSRDIKDWFEQQSRRRKCQLWASNGLECWWRKFWENTHLIEIDSWHFFLTGISVLTQKTKNRTSNKNGRQSIIKLGRTFIHRKANKGTILRGTRGELVSKQLKFPSLRWNSSHAVVSVVIWTRTTFSQNQTCKLQSVYC